MSATTTPLLPGASALLDLQGLGRLGHFLAVSTDATAWVRFYSSAAAREADGSSPITEDPSPGSGVLLDLITTSAALTIIAPAGGTYFSTETAAAAPLRRALVRNTGTAQSAIALTVSTAIGAILLIAQDTTHLSSATSLSNWRECKAGHRHPGFDPPHSADERHGRPPAPSAGTAALRLRWRQRGRRGNRWRTDAACHRAALAAGDLSPAARPHRPWIFSWVPILSPPPMPSSQNLIQLDFIAVIRAFLSGVPGRDVERKMRFKQAQQHRRQQSSTNEIPSL